MTEQQVIEQLQSYRQKEARLKVLSTYSVGAGIQISRLNEEDQLQDLHRRLRGLPSYLYLSKHEQQLETVAHMYLERYPAGTRAQLAAVPDSGLDEEDDQLLQELRGKIRKVIAARGGVDRDDIDEVLNRLAEFQDLKAEIAKVDTVLSALADYQPDYAKILRATYIEGKEFELVCKEFSISSRTYRRRINEAKNEYTKLAR
ncbi:MAG: polymerase subunit sigma-24 [Paenibacillus sp.]|jgi:hypothetical protein|nr:polymerase subunit sigma-24 [Paenibacillus sp.]